jgi:hypothetical protein
MEIVIQVNEHLLTRSLGALLTSRTTSAGSPPPATTTAASRTEFLDQLLGFFSVDRPVLIQIAFLIAFADAQCNRGGGRGGGGTATGAVLPITTTGFNSPLAAFNSFNASTSCVTTSCVSRFPG